VNRQEMKIIAHHKCRLLKPTPFEFIYLFVDVICSKVAQMEPDVKKML